LRWDTLSDALGRAQDLGFPPIERPDFDPPVIEPNEVDNMTSESFHLKNSQLAAWQAYASWRITLLNSYILQCENEVTSLSARIRIQGRSEKPKPAEAVIKDRVDANPRIEELRNLAQNCTQEREAIEQHRANYSRSIKALSRALTARGQDLEHLHSPVAYNPAQNSRSWR
jgi:hypothetical protein